MLCDDDDARGARLAYLRRSARRFSATRCAEAPEAAYTRLPSMSVALCRQPLHRHPSRLRRPQPLPPRPSESDRWDDEDTKEPWVRQILAEPRQPAYALAIARPAAVRALDVRHTVIRAERVANDIVLTGYRDRGGLMVTLIDLDGRPESPRQAQLRRPLRERGPKPRLQQPDRAGRQRPDGPADGWARCPTAAANIGGAGPPTSAILELDADGSLTPVGELSRRFEYAEKLPTARTTRTAFPATPAKCRASTGTAIPARSSPTAGFSG